MRKSKRFAAIALIASLGLVAAACGDDEKEEGGSTDTTEQTPDTTGMGSETTTGDTMPMADITGGVAFDTGGRGDGTFNDSAGVGADRAVDELGIDVTELEANVDEDREANLRLLAEDGRNVIVGVGFMFTDPSLQGHLAYDRFEGPVHLWNITDDHVFGPAPAVDELARQFSAAQVQRHTLDPQAVGLREIGHFAMFRRELGARLWPLLLAPVEAATPLLRARLS